jgi:Domain of unknown function (DUF1707)
VPRCDSIRPMVDDGGASFLAQRVGDAERDACISLLAEHHVSGRLSAEEFDLRQGAALRAVTQDDLVSLLRDLPVTAPKLGHEDSTSYSPVVSERASRSWARLAWALPPCAVVSTATFMSTLDREGEFLLGVGHTQVAALVAGAAGVLSYWCASVVNHPRP